MQRNKDRSCTVIDEDQTIYMVEFGKNGIESDDSSREFNEHHDVPLPDRNFDSKLGFSKKATGNQSGSLYIVSVTREVEPDIKSARYEFDLSLVEAANILGISTSTLEREESKAKPNFKYHEVARKYELYAASTDGKRKRQGNLIFGSLPIKVARHIFDISIEQMARKYGYSLGHWRKIETNFREISQEKIESIEQELKYKMKTLCEF